MYVTLWSQLTYVKARASQQPFFTTKRRPSGDRWLVVLGAAFAYFAVNSFCFMSPAKILVVDDEPDFQSGPQPRARIKLG